MPDSLIDINANTLNKNRSLQDVDKLQAEAPKMTTSNKKFIIPKKLSNMTEDLCFLNYKMPDGLQSSNSNFNDFYLTFRKAETRNSLKKLKKQNSLAPSQQRDSLKDLISKCSNSSPSEQQSSIRQILSISLGVFLDNLLNNQDSNINTSLVSPFN